MEFLSSNTESLLSRLQVTMGSLFAKMQLRIITGLLLCSLGTSRQTRYWSNRQCNFGNITNHDSDWSPSATAVGPQLFSFEQIKPAKITAGEQRRVCMRLTKSSVLSGSDKYLHLVVLNCVIRFQLTLDQAANVVKVNDATSNPTQSSQFQLEAAVLLWDAITLDIALMVN